MKNTKQWEVRIRKTEICNVVVIAESQEKARNKAEAGEWEATDLGETVDWCVLGIPKEDK